MFYIRAVFYFCLTFVFFRRTCRSGGCPVALIWRLWAMHWSWITSRGGQPWRAAPPRKLWKPPELLRGAGGWSCSWRPIQSQYCHCKGFPQGIWSLISTQGDNFTPKPKELWGFQSKAAVWHINTKPKCEYWTKVKTKIKDQSSLRISRGLFLVLLILLKNHVSLKKRKFTYTEWKLSHFYTQQSVALTAKSYSPRMNTLPVCMKSSDCC